MLKMRLLLFPLNYYYSWFPDRIKTVLLENYVPDTTDILFSRQSTIGIREYDFLAGDERNSPMRIVDVGGTRSQRNKWLSLFDGCHAFIFLASIGNYERKIKGGLDDESCMVIVHKVLHYSP